jgi:hypothetical protein
VYVYGIFYRELILSILRVFVSALTIVLTRFSTYALCIDLYINDSMLVFGEVEISFAGPPSPPPPS